MKLFKKFFGIEKQTNKAKLEIITNLIDSIEIKNGVVHIKTSKDLIIENEGSTLFFNKGYQILIGKEIHFNPEIDLNTPKTIKNLIEI